MRVVACNELGPLDAVRVELRPTPTAGPGQVVVDLRAAGVNFVDGLICEGKYQMKPAVPYVPGGEIAGIVSSVGDGVTDLVVGQRVMAMTGFGAFAEQQAVSVVSARPIPDRLSFAQAAAFIQSYSTAWYALTRRTVVAPGEWVLVLGAGGGIGLAAIDVSVALGARVIAAASSAAEVGGRDGHGGERDGRLRRRGPQDAGAGADRRRRRRRGRPGRWAPQ